MIPYQEGSWRGFGRNFKRSWRAFGRSLVPLGGLWGGLWGHVAAMVASLGTVLGALGAAGRHFWGLGAILRCFGRVSEVSEAILQVSRGFQNVFTGFHLCYKFTKVFTVFSPRWRAKRAPLASEESSVLLILSPSLLHLLGMLHRFSRYGSHTLKLCFSPHFPH